MTVHVVPNTEHIQYSRKGQYAVRRRKIVDPTAGQQIEIHQSFDGGQTWLLFAWIPEVKTSYR